jgi:hypothetical protein
VVSPEEAHALIAASRARDDAIRRALEGTTGERTPAKDERAVTFAEDIIEAEISYQAVVDSIVEGR